MPVAVCDVRRRVSPPPPPAAARPSPLLTLLLPALLLTALLPGATCRERLRRADVKEAPYVKVAGKHVENDVLASDVREKLPASNLDVGGTENIENKFKVLLNLEKESALKRKAVKFTSTPPLLPVPPEDPIQQDARGGQERRQQPPRKPAVPAAKPRPNLSQKNTVEWHEDSHYYALKASTDDRFRIRHMPVPEPGSPWPMPQLYQPTPVQYGVNPWDFRLHAAGETCDVLEVGFRRLLRLMFGHVYEAATADTGPAWAVAEARAGGGHGQHRSSIAPDVLSHWARQAESDGFNHQAEPLLTQIRFLNVTVLKECGGLPSLEMDESYDLEVKKSGASIIAREIWGALRGMETFGQLLHQNHVGAFVLNKTYIHDFPRFPHRGILLDTARHYLSLETIITNLEIMAQNKMNVFHWHMVDDQSFPFESKVFPQLTKMGAYDSETHVYTHEDIAEIIEEARLRGIRVIPEFDTPGHTYSWGYGQDNLLTPCYSYDGQPDGFFGPINPILKATYRFLQGLFTEVLTIFRDKYVHLGGDEVPFDCWYSNPFLSKFVKRNNLTSTRDLLNLYERKLLDVITDIGKERPSGAGYIVWQEVFDNGVKLKPDTIVQVWSGDTFDIGRVTGAGLRALFSSCWYLDYIGYGQDWDKYYRCEQIGTMLDDYRVRNQSLLLGGEACLWTEYADDESILPRLWPRATAAAERLWSSKFVVDVHQAAPRIEEQRCRMLRRGLPAGVLSGPGHCPRPGPRRRVARRVTDWRLSDSTAGDQSKLSELRWLDLPQASHVLPVLTLVCLCCLVLLLSRGRECRGGWAWAWGWGGAGGGGGAWLLPARLTLPTLGPSKKGVRGLVFAFMLFALVWCVWTSSIWLNGWGRSPPTGGPRAPPAHR